MNLFNYCNTFLNKLKSLLLRIVFNYFVIIEIFKKILLRAPTLFGVYS